MKNAFLAVLSIFSLTNIFPEKTKLLPPISSYEVVNVSSALNNTYTKQVVVASPIGKKILSCGWANLDATDAIKLGTLNTSQPNYNGTSWIINTTAIGGTTATWKLKVSCICASVE